jgi:5-methylcytosine-specific restriction endonuclease McrA
MTGRSSAHGKSCFYCNEAAEAMDHIVPFSKLASRRGPNGPKRSQNKDLQVPACKDCNSLLWTYSFPTMELRMIYLLGRLQAKRREPARCRFLARVIHLTTMEAAS